MNEIYFCPYCGNGDIIRIGISGIGVIYKCVSCGRHFTVVLESIE
jgi:transposase-like protein